MPFFKQVFALFLVQERLKWLGLLLLIVIMGVVEITAISLMVPFMATLSNPEIVTTSAIFHKIYTFFHFTSVNRFIFALGILIFSVLVLGNAFSAWVNWLASRFCLLQSYRLEQRMFAQYLSQPYVFFIDKNSVNLKANLLIEVQRLVKSVLMPLFDVVKAGFVSGCILILLLIIDPLLMFMIVLVLGGIYGMIFYVLRMRMIQWAHQSSKERKHCVKVAEEAFSGIKEIKLYHQERNINNSFGQAAKIFATQEAKGLAAATVPRYILEAIAFGGILLIILYLLRVKHDFAQVLPLIALYTFAGYRLMPMLQSIFSGWTHIRYNHAALGKLYADFEYLDQHKYLDLEGNVLTGETPVTFSHQIVFEHVTFSYPSTDIPSLRAAQLTIRANTMVGFVGKTGSGKTTLVDILLGLLEPNQGVLRVDDTIISHDNRRAWQKNLGYVSQHAYLNDDTIANNIAFNAGADGVDMQRVIAVAKIAKIHDFITNDLPLSYETLVGERGVRLSGGQRQRICIARALYHDPKVLVFDEATSALDNETEHAVMESIRTLGKTKTIIMIAHRLSTIKTCDTIFVLDKGQVVGEGSYESLLENNPIFKTLVEVTSQNIT